MRAFHVKQKEFVQLCSAPSEGRAPSSNQLELVTMPPRTQPGRMTSCSLVEPFHVKRVAVIPFQWIGYARPTTFRAPLTAR